MPTEKPEDNTAEETRQQQREKRRRRKRERMPKHGKGLAQVYRDAVLKRVRKAEKEEDKKED